MASATIFRKRSFDEMFLYLTGFKCDSEFIMRLNYKNLSVNGDMYFLTSFKFWKTILGDNLVCHENCTDILQHYAHTKFVELKQDELSKTKEKIVELLLLDYDLWDFGTIKFSLKKERVCLFLDRPFVIESLLLELFKKESKFGYITNEYNGELAAVCKPDIMVDMTSVRLFMIREACNNILELHGYDSEIKRGIRLIGLTSKSPAKQPAGPPKRYDIYVCGAVRNVQTNTKEKTLTITDYINDKIKGLTKLNEQRSPHKDEPDAFVKMSIEQMAEAAIKFELLSVKPSRPVFMNLNTDTDRTHTNTKGIQFIFYNIVRMKSIIDIFRTAVKDGIYRLPNYNKDINCSILNEILNEEEWELIYYLTLGYLEAVKNSFKLKPTLQIAPHSICMFLSQLSHKFSIYYSRNKILVNQRDVKSQVLIRICILEALLIVMKNALRILDIKPVDHM